MLERDGVLKTWSIPAAFKPNTRIVKAKMLPDHRLLYLAYEGKLSRGRGSVKIWDRGNYKVWFWDKHVVCVNLNGGKLKGRYLLIRADKIWLLIRRSPAVWRDDSKSPLPLPLLPLTLLPLPRYIPRN
ncbi:MAG: ATP-dependent DNA ligase [Planctomycetes bacterium]|nr:ATP-dependent DNA ligase [Planctomycetota bacterium]